MNGNGGHWLGPCRHPSGGAGLVQGLRLSNRCSSNLCFLFAENVAVTPTSTPHTAGLLCGSNETLHVGSFVNCKILHTPEVWWKMGAGMGEGL